MAEQINSKFSAQHQQNQKNPDALLQSMKGTSESVDLDNLFAFLSEVTPNGQNSNSNAIINEIGEKMDNLVDDLDIELESVIQQEIEGLTNERNLINNHQQPVMQKLPTKAKQQNLMQNSQQQHQQQQFLQQQAQLQSHTKIG